MKKVGSSIYIHKSAINQISEKYLEFYNAIFLFKDSVELEYEVIKWDNSNKTISFIESDNWNEANEPNVGRSVVIKTECGDIKIISPKGQIYHHKWMFVNDDYDGFDVSKSKERSIMWESILPKTKDVKSRIGYKKYWNALLEEYNLPK